MLFSQVLVHLVKLWKLFQQIIKLTPILLATTHMRWPVLRHLIYKPIWLWCVINTLLCQLDRFIVMRQVQTLRQFLQRPLCILDDLVETQVQRRMLDPLKVMVHILTRNVIRPAQATVRRQHISQVAVGYHSRCRTCAS
jgi:hypothetical protein